MPTLPVAIDARGMKTGAAVADKSLKKIRGSSKLTRDELGRFQKRAVGVGKSIQGLRGSFLGLFGAFSAFAVLRSAVKTVADFEETIVTLGKVSGATEDQLLSLEVTARKFGATTRFSANEAGQGLLFLARAGFTADESIEALPATLNLAQAGLLSLGAAADLASNILKQFGLPVTDTARAVDDLINVSNRANTNVEQLGQALSFVGPIARAAGQSLEVTTAQIGVLGDAGIQATRAGTALRGVMLALASPTSLANKTFAQLGLSLVEMQAEGKGTTEILEALAKAGIDVGQAADIFGRRNAAAALIIGNSAERVRELTKAQEDNRGAAEEQARAMDDTLGGALKGLTSAFEELQLAISDSGGGLKEFVEAITDGLRHIVGLREGFKGTATRAALVAAAMKLVVVGFTAFVALKLITFVSGLAVAMFKLAAGSTAAAIATSPLITIFALLAAAVAGITIGKFLGDEFKLAAQFAAGFAEGFLKIVETIKLGWNNAASFMGVVWTRFTSGIKIAWSEVQGFLQKGVLEVMGFFDDSLDVDLAKSLVDRETTANLAKELAKVAAVQKKFQDKAIAETANTQMRINAIRKGSLDTFAKIEEDFGNKQRKGGSLFDSAVKDLKKLLTDVGGLNDKFSLTSKVTLEVNTNISDAAKGTEDLGDAVDNIIPKFNELTESQKLLKSIIGGVSNTLTDGILDAIKGAKSLREILKDTGKQISEQIARQLISSAITKGLNSLLGVATAAATPATATPTASAVVSSANGNVFANSNLIPMANGGIVSGPTTFPLNGGKTGLMGEAGPEAVLPLTRNSRGQLSVNTTGGGPQRSITVVQHFNITTPDAESFRASKKQIMSDASTSIKGAVS